MKYSAFGSISSTLDGWLTSLNKFQPDRNNWIPLTWACFLNLPSLVSLMMEKGASVEHKDIYGVSCLSWAAGRGHAEVVRLLIEGAQLSVRAINSPDRYGSTPLLWSCRKGENRLEYST